VFVKPAFGTPWRRRAAVHGTVLASFLALAVAMTWPLARLTTLPDHDDAYFSVWRLAWIAHQLPRDPVHLFDANIFHPARWTLAYSDAVLLLGAAGAPLAWLGAHPVAVHDVLLVSSFALAAWGAHALAARLTGNRVAAIVAGLVFGFAPYRIAHIGHLELLWTAWMPLGLLALHAALDRPTAWRGAGVGLVIGLQTLSSIYYGVFLTFYIALAAVAVLVTDTRRVRLARESAPWRNGALVAALAAMLAAAALVSPYARPYAAARAEVSPRSQEELDRYSAKPADYLRSTTRQWFVDDREADIPTDERTLFPGFTALGLALIALLPPLRRAVVVHVALLLVAFDASLGVHGWSFHLLRLIPPLEGLRAPARFGALVLLSLSVLAACGAARLVEGRRRATRYGIIALLVAACAAEYWSAPLPVRRPALQPPAVYVWLAGRPADTVVLELPVPTSDSLWGFETTHQYHSVFHWRRTINGYSGFAPQDYIRTLHALRTFPDDESVARLRRLSVDYVLLHREALGDQRYAALATRLVEHPAFSGPLSFGAGTDEVAVFALR
jgi:hypothetical protein